MLDRERRAGFHRIGGREVELTNDRVKAEFRYARKGLG